ncbi:hypothetical protein GQ53DRAFT_265888 [Thozetella sp. PMI_491]|nr:hypothetical protein GQ53DRAFT_265888 [Thozetella sp. PMI_491]
MQDRHQCTARTRMEPCSARTRVLELELTHHLDVARQHTELGQPRRICGQSDLGDDHRTKAPARNRRHQTFWPAERRVRQESRRTTPTRGLLFALLVRRLSTWLRIRTRFHQEDVAILAVPWAFGNHASSTAPCVATLEPLRNRRIQQETRLFLSLILQEGGEVFDNTPSRVLRLPPRRIHWMLPRYQGFWRPRLYPSYHVVSLHRWIRQGIVATGPGGRERMNEYMGQTTS